MGSNEVLKSILFKKNQSFEPFYTPPRGEADLLTSSNTENFDPLEGLEGSLCPWINIFSNIYIIDTHLGTSD